MTLCRPLQMDACAARGMSALAGGTPPPDAVGVVSSCMDSMDFPPALAPFVEDFNDCIGRVLT